MWARPTPLPFTILPLNPPLCACVSPLSSLYPLVVHKDSALSCQMELPKPASHHLDNHFLLFAFYVDLIIFHLQRDGNHKLRCVPYAFAQIKHVARFTESANGGRCYRIFNVGHNPQRYCSVLHTSILSKKSINNYFLFFQLIIWPI